METASLMVAILSLVISIIALVCSAIASNVANRISAKDLNVSYATIELDMRRSINEASVRVSELSLQMRPLITRLESGTITGEERNQLSALERSFTAATENYLNVYDELCGKYIDSKIDKVRFRKSFNFEVRNLVEREALKTFFDPTTSRYKAILRVYDEWENLEK